MGCALLNEQKDKFMTLVIKSFKGRHRSLNNYGKHSVGLDNFGKQKLRHTCSR